MTIRLQNYSVDAWVSGVGAEQPVVSAINGEVVALASSGGLDFAAMLEHARSVGGPALRAMTFHQRANILKALAQAIIERKEELYALSVTTGATRGDSWIDIEGGAGTLFSISAKGRRELPDDVLIVDGELEQIGKEGTFVGQHVYTTLHGAALHINAFNFPVWGMLEKLGPALLAGIPVIVKPATATAQVAEHAVRIMIETGVLPRGGLQLIVGPVGDTLDHLGCQDVVSFTGSAATAVKLQTHPVIAREAVRFIAERDSINASILGPDADADSPEFGLFVKEIVREMTVKAGQKCTAIRRAFVPRGLLDRTQQEIEDRLSKVVIGDPANDTVTMGALVGISQREDVRAKARELATECKLIFGSIDTVETLGDAVLGAYQSPLLFRNDDPWTAKVVHDLEIFGPVCTLMPYDDPGDALALANRGNGSLALSVFSHSPDVVRAFVLGSGAFHGRLAFIDRDCAKESTGHGSPLPMLIHGGPGRAGGGEEMGGMRAVKHYMQRSALQGSPRSLSTVVRQWLPGAPQTEAIAHPFRKRFGELELGYTLKTESRTITLDDVEHFAHFTGDTFYAHMDEVAAAASPIFGGRVAHGYLILSFAAGLFVDPAPGPVLANFGLENLRFIKPVKPGESIKVALTAKAKSLRSPKMGEVRWSVAVTNQDNELVAAYDLLTMNAV
ncbi:phenylacetic acid degradation bifunctional protein PaaZ [Sphingopyxis sp. C-1]|uniref:phenylacetic acid degradation bifunctional protein PaaZ n=1 Tax=Sphingopyxis sp. C-1 TaxID=262667 RepID=UPI0006C10405|nr:phenylacetic acid degradation bifunctional protein PaaZ [Sphingopyxis sp. C-1]GAO80988.1 aldehyde dehydrogenase, PaaZ [Sphingopyxis sp. C-1]